METFKINNVDYLCEFKLKNADGQEKEITKSAIRGMDIVDNIFEPFCMGTISIANPFDYLEDDFSTRGDGRDELSIEFGPKESKDKYKKTFMIVGDGNISKMDTRAENIKQFSIIDINSRKFMDLVPYMKSYSGMVGDILKDIFIELLGKELVDEEKWETGDMEFTITPPSTYKYIDLVRYLLKIYYAKDNGVSTKSYISYDSKLEKFTFEMLTKVFEDNKKRVLESFSLGDLTSNLNFKNPNNPPPDADFNEYYGQLKHVGVSTPFYSWNSEFFINSIVVAYDNESGFHKMKKISLEETKKKFEEKFVNCFKCSGGKPKTFIPINNTSKQRFRTYKLPYRYEDSVSLVEADIYSSLVFYNLHANFMNLGDVKRESGKFVDIFETRNPDIKLKFHEKILGRWYVTEVHHVFNGDIYPNEFYMCKTYMGTTGNVKEDVE